MPRKRINRSQIYELARIGATNEEIATIMRVAKNSLSSEYKKEMDRGRAELNVSLRRQQIYEATEGKKRDVMLIWLGKNLLGQTDRTEAWQHVKYEHVSPKTLRQSIEREFGVSLPSDRQVIISQNKAKQGHNPTHLQPQVGEDTPN